MELIGVLGLFLKVGCRVSFCIDRQVVDFGDRKYLLLPYSVRVLLLFNQPVPLPLFLLTANSPCSPLSHDPPFRQGAAGMWDTHIRLGGGA